MLILGIKAIQKASFDWSEYNCVIEKYEITTIPTKEKNIPIIKLRLPLLLSEKISSNNLLLF